MSVRASTGALGGGLLGAHVLGRAERQPGLGQARPAGVAEGQGDAEVGDQCIPVGEQDVLRLDVAMHRPMAMGVVERGTDGRRDVYRVGNGELVFAHQPRAEGFAVHKGHHIEQEPIGASGIEERQDVRVLQRSCELDLLEKALAAEDGGELGAEDLDGDFPAVLQVLGEVDGGHAAGAEFALDAVAVGQGVSEAARSFRFEQAAEVADHVDVGVPVFDGATARRPLAEMPYSAGNRGGAPSRTAAPPPAWDAIPYHCRCGLQDRDDDRPVVQPRWRT